MEPTQIETTLPAKSEKVVEVAVRSSEAISTSAPALLQLHWMVGYDLANKDELFLDGTHDIPLQPSPLKLVRTVAPEFVGPLTVAIEKPEDGFTVRYTTDGIAPQHTSTAYEEPIIINDATTVQARMFNSAGHGTATSRQTYKSVPAGTGLRYRIYQGSWTRMPKYDDLKPVFESVTSDLLVESRQLSDDNWAVVLDGNFEVERPGKYTFFLNSDDGSKLYIDDQLVIDNDGDHSLLELSGEKELTAGKHKLRIEFFEAGGEAVLELDLAGPGMERRAFPVDKVTH
jgi:hypothetical protein